MRPVRRNPPATAASALAQRTARAQYSKAPTCLECHDDETAALHVRF
jgi:cytochrome c553